MNFVLCFVQSQETDEISNLQLAWEMLELSKLIYKRLVGLVLFGTRTFDHWTFDHRGRVIIIINKIRTITLF